MNKDTEILIGVGILAFLLLRRGGMAAPVRRNTGIVPSMPGSAGTGTQQVLAGALGGFLNAIANGLGNSGSDSYIQRDYPPAVQAQDAVRGMIDQDRVSTPWDENPVDTSGYDLGYFA